LGNASVFDHGSSLLHTINPNEKDTNMSIPLADTNFVEVALYGEITAGGINSVRTANIFHFRRTSVVNPVDKLHISAAFQTNIVAVLALALNNRWSQTFNAVRLIDDADDPPQLFPQTAVGAVAGDGMSSESMIYINLKTAMRGRSNRGNKKFGPLSESNTTTPNSDILNAGAETLFDNVRQALITPFIDSDGNTWKLGILSQKLSQLRVNPTTVWCNDVVTALLNKRISAMDRRKSASSY
jgi:hypothetical protein